MENKKMSYRLFWSAMALVWLSSSAHAGYIEICKDADPAGSLSGLFDFTVAGQSGTFSTPAGSCTSDFQLPDGLATITELGPDDATFVGVSTFPDDRLVSFDAATETAVVLVEAGDISAETVVTFTDAPNGGVPEPGTGWLVGLGLTLWAIRRSGPIHRFSLVCLGRVPRKRHSRKILQPLTGGPPLVFGLSALSSAHPTSVRL
jgi:hypothetical protein